MESINVTRSSMPPYDEYCLEIKELWDSRWLTNMGVKHRLLESSLCKFLGTPNITLFTNGHLALESAIAAFGLTGEVITTPFTFASTTHAIVRNGLTPVFCDINDYDYTIDVSKIEPLITEKTSAILPVHVYGNLCDVDAIEKIANKYKLKIIYDAAHAFGITINGISVANFGDASMFSFHATKVFHTIEGGAVTFSDETIKDKLNYIKNFGIMGIDSVVYEGANAKMNEFQAAMGICNLRYISEEIIKRKLIHERYIERLSEVSGIRLPHIAENIKGNYAYFPVVFDDYIFCRDEIYYKLKHHNIISRKYFYPLTNNFECYVNRFKTGRTAIANKIANNVLTLPIYADMLISDVDKICAIIMNDK